MRYNITATPFNICVCHSLALFCTLSKFLPVYLHFCDCVVHNDAEHGTPPGVAHSADGRCLLILQQGMSNATSHYPKLFLFCFYSFILLYLSSLYSFKTNCLKQRPFRKANRSSASQEIPPVSFYRFTSVRQLPKF